MTDKFITNKVAVITGSTGGLGSEIVKVFLKNGYRIVLNYFKSEISAREIENTFGKDRVIAIRADVSRFDEVYHMAETVYNKWGCVSVLINNAGITRDNLLIKQTEREWDSLINVNLKGVFNTIKAFAPLMKEGGHVINISSYSAVKGKEGQAAYSASKSAMLGLTKSASIELAQYKIRVNAILPGYMPTKMGLNARNAINKAKEDSLLNVLSDPKEVARFILYLVGTENITGQIFPIDSRIIF